MCVPLMAVAYIEIFRPGIFGPFTALPWIMVFKVLYTKWQREKRLHHESGQSLRYQRSTADVICY